jgi:hypothetical protein
LSVERLELSLERSARRGAVLFSDASGRRISANSATRGTARTRRCGSIKTECRRRRVQRFPTQRFGVLAALPRSTQASVPPLAAVARIIPNATRARANELISRHPVPVQASSRNSFRSLHARRECSPRALSIAIFPGKHPVNSRRGVNDSAVLDGDSSQEMRATAKLGGKHVRRIEHLRVEVGYEFGGRCPPSSRFDSISLPFPPPSL